MSELKPTPPAEPAKRSPAPRRRLTWIAIGVAASLAVIFGIGLYAFSWHGEVMRIVTKLLPYPAAIVNGHAIRYSEFQDDLSVLQKFYQDEHSTAAAGSIFPTDEELRARIMDQLIKDKLAESLAARYRITVSTEDVNAYYEKTILDPAVLSADGGKPRAEARAADTLQKRFGLRPSQFKNLILQPFLVRQKLQEAIVADETLNAEKRKKAEAARAALLAGQPFKEVAAAYSEDTATAASGGDRGVIGPGLLPAEVEAAAKALKPGETSAVVKSALGYHVLRVPDRVVSGGVVKLHVLEVFVRPIQIDEYLEAQKKTASIITFVH